MGASTTLQLPGLYPPGALGGTGVSHGCLPADRSRSYYPDSFRFLSFHSVVVSHIHCSSPTGEGNSSRQKERADEEPSHSVPKLTGSSMQWFGTGL